jgi:hypothetical protein
MLPHVPPFRLPISHQTEYEAADAAFSARNEALTAD